METIFVLVAIAAFYVGVFYLLLRYLRWSTSLDMKRQREVTRQNSARLQELFPDWTSQSIGELSGLVRADGDGVEFAVEIPEDSQVLNFELGDNAGLTIAFGEGGGRRLQVPLSVYVEGIGRVRIKEFRWYKRGTTSDFIARSPRPVVELEATPQAPQVPKPGASREEIFDYVRWLISENIGIDEAKIEIHSRFREDFELEDIDMIDMIMNIEDEFDLDDIEEEVAQSLESVSDVVDYLESELAPPLFQEEDFNLFGLDEDELPIDRG